MKKIIAVVILAVFAAGFFGLMVPRHVLNTLGLARADCDRQNCFSIRRATTCCGRLPRAKWALKVRNARYGWHLEIPAIQLITPKWPDAANYEAERERGQDFESHHHC